MSKRCVKLVINWRPFHSSSTLLQNSSLVRSWADLHLTILSCCKNVIVFWTQNTNYKKNHSYKFYFFKFIFYHFHVLQLPKKCIEIFPFFMSPICPLLSIRHSNDFTLPVSPPIYAKIHFFLLFADATTILQFLSAYLPLLGSRI